MLVQPHVPAHGYFLESTDAHYVCMDSVFSACMCVSMCVGCNINLLLLISSVPSDEPQNFRVTAVESQSIELQWDRPTTPNGFIVSYDIQYMDRGSPVTMRLDNATFTYNASELNEYTDHTFNITALTRVGSGPVAMVEQRTAEDGN